MGPYKSIHLPDELVDRIDAFVADNDWGYRSRAEVAASAIRAFLQHFEGHITELMGEMGRHQTSSEARRKDDERQ